MVDPVSRSGRYSPLVLLVLLFATPAFAQQHVDHWWMKTMLAGSAVVHGADVATTMYVCGQVSPEPCPEANPILKPFADQGPVTFAIAKMSFAAGLNWFLYEIHKTRPRLAAIVGYAQIGAVAYVAWHNSQQIRDDDGGAAVAFSFSKRW